MLDLQEHRKLNIYTQAKRIILWSLVLIFCLFSNFAFAEEVVIDNGGSGTSSTGTWKASSGANPYGSGSIYAWDTATYRWHANLPQSGNYEVYMWWTEFSNRSTSAAVRIIYNGASQTVYVNQQINGGKWNLLGTYAFDAAAGGTVRLYVPKATSTYTTYCADAVKFVYLPAVDMPPTGTIKIDNDATYTNSTSVTLNLSATDDSGIVSQMQFSNDGSTWSTPEAYSTTKNWVITSGDGTKTVYAKFKDEAGNWSEPVSDTIILDTYQINKIPLEAESGVITLPFQTYSDSNASNGQYVRAPNGTGKNLTPPGGPGSIVFSFDVTQADTYQVWARVIAPNGEDDSFFVQIDDGPVQLWDTPQGSTWHWKKVKDRSNGTFNANLPAGAHTLYFGLREDGVSLDKVIIINDSNFVPGSDDVTPATDTTAPQITNLIPSNNSTFYENEDVLISPTVEDTDPSPLEYQFSIDEVIKQAWASSDSYTWSTTSQDSSLHNIKVEVRDEGGEDSQQVEIYIFRKPILPPE